MNAAFKERFFSKVSVTPGCWIWLGAKRAKGYGLIICEGKMTSAHRASYQMHIGEIAEGNQVCHSCDNPSCVNPAHLYSATAKQNNEDKVARNRQAKGEAVGTSKLSESDVNDIRSMYVRQSKDTNSRKLAAKYGVVPSTIIKIINGDKWKHSYA